ncbi:MAG: bphA2 [Acidimicrobiales bacterium]|nr:bphA2 [Acidimicrobiales bacterium]
MALHDAPAETRHRWRVGTEAHNEVLDFLIEEAWILDDGRYAAWLEMLGEEIEYFMPTRSTVYRNDGLGFSENMGHYDETRKSLELRVRRLLESTSAWTEAPPSRTRRLVTNVQVWDGDAPDEYLARSACLLLRNRIDNPTFDMLSTSRRDTVRRSGDSFVLIKRRIEIDQATLGTPNLSMFF